MRYIVLFTLVLASFGVRANIISYDMQWSLTQPFGSLVPGSTLNVHVSFDSSQSGIQLLSPANVRRFELIDLSVQSGNDLIFAQKIPGVSDAWLVVGDNATSDVFSIWMERNLPNNGSIGGIPLTDMILSWNDTKGVATNGYALPLDVTTFGLFDINEIFISSFTGVFARGTLHSVTAVPLPLPALLFISGLSTLLISTNRRKVN
jgi:hypothetical protein